MKNLLPKVSIETLGEAMRGLKSEGTDYIQKICDSIDIENPVISEYIAQSANESSDPKAVIQTIALVYHCLEKQAESDRLVSLQ